MMKYLLGSLIVFTSIQTTAAEKIAISKPSDVCMRNFCLDDDVSKYIKHIPKSHRVKKKLTELNDKNNCLSDSEYVDQFFDRAFIDSGNDKFTVFFLPYVDEKNFVSLKVSRIYYYQKSLNKATIKATYDAFVNKYQSLENKKDERGFNYVWKDENRYFNVGSPVNSSDISVSLSLTEEGAKKQLERVKLAKPNCYKASEL